MGVRKLRAILLIFAMIAIGGCSVFSFTPQQPAGSSQALTQAAQLVISSLTPLPLTLTARVTIVPTVAFSTTQPPTNTPLPKPTATLEPIAAMPVITVNVYTYCRDGPGDNFLVDAIVFPGDAFTPQAKNADGSWWYVATPKLHRKRPADHCWIFNGTTSITGNAKNVPVMVTPTP